MSFTAQDVKALRESSGAGMMDCKKALDETGGDLEAAKQLLREKGLAASAKRDDRESNQGVVAMQVDGDVAAHYRLGVLATADIAAAAAIGAGQGVLDVSDPGVDEHIERPAGPGWQSPRRLHPEH